MSCKLRKALVLLFTVMLMIGVSLLVNHYIQYGKGEQVQTKALQLVTPNASPEPPVLVEITQPEVPLSQAPITEQSPPDDHALALANLDISALQGENADILGWIRIPGTKIDYPLLAADSSDEYLHTAWDGSYSYSGSIYLECQNSRDFSDFHTIIYGHNMKNGTMFGNLIGYADPAFRNDHPYVYILAGGTVRRYEIFSAYTADIQSDTYRISFRSHQRKEQAISHYLESSLIDTQTVPDGNSQILTLSTCTGNQNYDERWVVQAVLDASWQITQ